MAVIALIHGPQPSVIPPHIVSVLWPISNYELNHSLQEDDFDYHPETSFDALDLNKRFIDYNIDCLVNL